MHRFDKGVPVTQSVSALKLVLLLSAILAEAISAHGQVQPNIENGFKSYGSYDSSSIENINLSNGGLTVKIPLPLAYPQRGGKSTPSYYLVANSKNWQVQWYNNGTAIVYFWNYGPPANSGVYGGPVGAYIAATNSPTFSRTWVGLSQPNFTPTASDSEYQIRDWDNSVHQLKDVTGKRTLFESSDLSGYRVVPSTPDPTWGTPNSFTITDRKGNVYSASMKSESGRCTTTTGAGVGGTTTITCLQNIPLRSLTDSNGNAYSITADTLGREVPVIPSSPTTAECVSNFFSYIGPNGTAEQISACFESVRDCAKTISHSFWSKRVVPCG